MLFLALACWAVGAFVFAVLPAEAPAGRYVAAIALYYPAAIFALVCAARAVLIGEGRARTVWGLLGAGVAVWCVGDLGWPGLQGAAFGTQGLSPQHAAYIISYLLLAGALLYLVVLTTEKIALVTALDALSVMLSVGVLIWYFFLGRAVAAAGPGPPWEVFATLSWPLFDAALLFLSLVVLSVAGRPPYAGLLAAGFLAFAVADGLYLGARTGGSYGPAGWPDVFWALGLVFLGLAALTASAAPEVLAGPRIQPWRVFAFWIGPLSPPVHLCVVLAWGATHPPLPPFAAAGGAVLFVYLALRVALVSFVSRRLAAEQEEAARELEGARVLYELHDTVKQGAHGVSLALASALEAERRGDRGASRGLLERALKTARETEYQVSKPYDELQLRAGGDMAKPDDYVRHRLGRFEEYFGVKTHEDFKVPLESLSPAELAAFNRVSIEAGWNVAKHAGARNMYLESRRIGDVSLFRIRDDGRGFAPGDPPPGLGLDYMRRRAAEAGAELDVISAPARGTTVQLRFRAR